MAIGVALRLAPLSDNTILYNDMQNQFVSFFSALKNLFGKNTNLAYTFSKIIGGDMVSFMAYYMQNPLLFILAFVKDKHMPLAIYIVETFMLSLAGVTFQMLTIRLFNRSSLLFSTAYSMMGYALAYFVLYMYMGNYILLPIVIIGFVGLMENGFKDKKATRTYTLSLAASIFVNYYIGYMMCLYLVLFFIAYCIATADNASTGPLLVTTNHTSSSQPFEVPENSAVLTEKTESESSSTQNAIHAPSNPQTQNLTKLPTIHRAIVLLPRFATCSIIACLIPAFSLVPTVLGLGGQKSAPDMSIMALKREFRLISLPRNFLPNAFYGNLSNQCIPYVYIGLIPLVFVAVFFISRRINLRKKLAALFILGAITISLYLRPLNIIWHAFNEPWGFAHRFAFLLSFTMLIIAMHGYCALEDSTKLSAKTKKLCILALALIVCLDMSANSYRTLKVQVAGSLPQSKYEEYMNRLSSLAERIKSLEPEDAFYRFEKDVMGTMQDPMVFDYAGLTHYSSCEKSYVREFMSKFGFRNTINFAFYNQGSTSFADCFFGVKYFASRFDSTEKPYESLFAEQDMYAFENPYALPLAFPVDSGKIAAVNYDTENPFEFQNEVAKSFDFDEDIFKESEIVDIRVMGDVDFSDTFTQHISNQSKLGNQQNIHYVNQTDNTTNIATTDTDATTQQSLEFDVKVGADNRILYFYFTAPKAQSARIYINDIDWDDYFSDWRWNVEKAGTFHEGDIVTIRIESTGDELAVDDYFIYEEDLETLKNWRASADNLGANKTALSKKSASHVVGQVEVAKDATVVFSIPYDKGWKVKIDGKKITCKPSLSILESVDVSAGVHSIDMYYIPNGLILGIILSLIGVVLLIVITNRKDSPIKAAS